MQYEVQKDPNREPSIFAILSCNQLERPIINDGLFHLMLVAATEGPTIELDSPLGVMALIFHYSSPENQTVTFKGFLPDIEVLIQAVEESNREHADIDKASISGKLKEKLTMARDAVQNAIDEDLLLSSLPNRTIFSSEEIDNIVRAQTIPNSPDDL